MQADLDPRGTIPLGLPVAGTSGVLIGRPGHLMGWSLRETTGTTAAVFRIRNGQDSNGVMVGSFRLNAAESSRDWLGPQGVFCTSGLALELVSGTIEGAIWYDPL